MAGFRDLADRLAQLAKVASRVATPVAARISVSLADQFRNAVNAYGNPWKALLPQTVRRKRGDARILMRTDALAAETVATPISGGAGVEITSLDYGNFHQTGTKRMVARKILPDGTSLPPVWTEAIQDSLDAEFSKRLP